MDSFQQKIGIAKTFAGKGGYPVVTRAINGFFFWPHVHFPQITFMFWN